MDALLKKNGGKIDVSDLTAQPEDVTEGYTFVGAGSTGNKTGKLKNLRSPEYALPINGTMELPAGVYEGGSVKQSIQTLGEQKVKRGKNIII